MINKESSIRSNFECHTSIAVIIIAILYNLVYYTLLYLGVVEKTADNECGAHCGNSKSHYASQGYTIINFIAYLLYFVFLIDKRLLRYSISISILIVVVVIVISSKHSSGSDCGRIRMRNFFMCATLMLFVSVLLYKKRSLDSKSNFRDLDNIGFVLIFIEFVILIVPLIYVRKGLSLAVPVFILSILVVLSNFSYFSRIFPGKSIVL